ncbi:MAG TPA: ABC transporter permease [Candidatus Lokiarchaeia archaeon]|nr:ABC transporter permease [Candidatus Lokiarchaeia archaeon]
MPIYTNRSRGNIKERIRTNWNDFVYAFKDLKTNKTKTFFAIGGICLSIFVMQVVGVLTDSLSYSYLDASATQAGAADFWITRNIQANPTANAYMNQTQIQAVLDNVSDIQSVFPRLALFPIANVLHPQPGDQPNRTITFYGLDVPGEDAGGLGRFKYADNDSFFTSAIPDGKCIVSPYIRDTLHVKVGDNVTLHFATFPVQNLRVMAVVDPQEKFTSVEIDTVITNLQWVQNTYSLNGQVNYFLAIVKNWQLVYDTRNIDGTVARMRQIGQEVQTALNNYAVANQGNPYDYTVQMLKLQQLESSNTLNLSMSVAFVFISVISGLIAAILINSILSTAVEDRIREFGIFRVVGSRRSFSFKLVIYQGLFLAIIGSGIGIVAGTWFAQFALPIFYNLFHLWTNPIALVVQPTTILTTFSIGVGITLVVTALPAYKAATTKIVQAINPYRHQETGWAVKREGRISWPLIAAGSSAVAAGSLVFYLIPQLVLTGDITVILIAFIGVQIAFLLGLTLVSLGFIPGLERLILQLFRIFNKKTTPLIRTSLYRYRRRNTSTVLMFSMTFAFVLFIGTTLELMKVSQSYLITVGYGTPVVCYSTDTSNQVDQHLMNVISQIPNVRMVSGVYSDAIDLNAVLLQLTSSGAGGLAGGISFGGGGFGSIFNSSTRFQVQIGDLIDYYSYTAALIGIDENYTKVMPADLMEGVGVSTVNDLFTVPNGVIIAKDVATSAQLNVGDHVRLTFTNHTNYHLVNATVIGISNGMPGFWEFRQAVAASFYAGVLCSKENYISWENMSRYGSNQPLSKIFIDTTNSSAAATSQLSNDINSVYKNTPEANGKLYNFISQDSQSRVDATLSTLSTVQLLFQTILVFAIMIALFGLLSSVYSTVLERKREIGVLKALGLQNKSTRNLFIMESVIILLSSSIGGALIGILSSYINQYENATLTEVPMAAITNITNLPWSTMLGSFAFALIVCLGGMFILLRKIEKMEIMDIFRSTM